VRFTEILTTEFHRRRGQNPRYSLRGFARSVGVHHATLSRLMTARRPVQANSIRAIGPRLGLTPADVESLIAIEDAEFIIHAVKRPAFRPDSRWLASQSGIPIDRVNIALHRLIYQRQLRMESRDRWSVTCAEGATSE
jgi:plasmid maintenance system antidote protein VapI